MSTSCVSAVVNSSVTRSAAPITALLYVNKTGTQILLMTLSRDRFLSVNARINFSSSGEAWSFLRIAVNSALR